MDLGSVQTIDRIRLTWENAFGKDFRVDISTVVADPSDASWSNIVNGSWNTPVADIKGNSTTVNEYANLDTSGRYVRMYGTARASPYGYSLFEFEIFNYTINTASNLANGKNGLASSVENNYVANNAFDNTTTTRWSSNYTAALPADSAFIYIDLKSTATISRIYLLWETAYGADFKLEVSNDALTWRGLARVTGNTMRYNDLAVAGTGRYVRMHALKRGTNFGYSLYEFQVYGTFAPLPVTLTVFQG